MARSRIIDDEIDTSYDLRKSEHQEKIRSEAVKCMEAFFRNKNYWAGGAIPKSKLYKEEHIKAVMEMNIMDAFALAYYCLGKNQPESVDVLEKDWDSKICYDCLKECERTLFEKGDSYCRIPKCHAAGIMLVYLSLCHGVDFIPVLKKMSEIRSIFAKKEREMDAEEK